MQITANDIQLEYQTYGLETSVPLILIRGLGTQLIHWPNELMKNFAKLGYYIIIFDNRDVGLSQRFPSENVTGNAEEILAIVKKGGEPKPAYHIDDMAEDVIGLMDALNITKAHIFGISMGGVIAQHLASHHAKRLLSASIVMSAARISDKSILEKILAYPQSRDEYIESWVQGERDWGSHGFAVKEEYLRVQAAQAWERGAEAEGINRQLLATFNSADRTEKLKKINLPCLVIHGAIDALIPMHLGEEIAKLIPDSELKIIDGMGHTITPLLAPVICKYVHEFIQKTMMAN